MQIMEYTYCVLPNVIQDIQCKVTELNRTEQNRTELNWTQLNSTGFVYNVNVTDG